MRVTAEQVKANERGLRQGVFLREFDKEAARRHGPRSSTNDEQRERWEQELRQGRSRPSSTPSGNPPTLPTVRSTG
jgi:hypothetical protein